MRYSERLSSLKLRISCFGLRKMQLLSVSPDYSKWFSFRLQLPFWRLNERYRQFEHQEMCIRINVANYSQFNAKTMFTTVYKSVLQTNSVVTSLSFWPIGVWKCLSSIKMQAINYESRATRSYSSSSVTLCVVRFESDLTFSFRPFASDLRRRNLSKKETNKLEFAYEHIFLLKIITVAFQLYRSW